MKDRAPLRAALEHSNVRAFLRVLRESESRQTDDAYRLENGGRVYPEHPVEHPWKGQRSPPGRAFGAYQFIATTWAGLVKQYGFENMGPQCQDEAAVALIMGRGALDEVLAGDLDGAFYLLHPEWTSLPGGSEENSATARARRVFVEWGGQIKTVTGDGSGVALPDFNPDSLATEHYGEAVTESTIPQEASMPAPIVGALLSGLASTLIEGFAPLAREKAAKALARHTDSPELAQQVAGVFVDAAKSVTGKLDAVAAVAAAREDPAIMARVQDAALEGLDKLAPILDKVAALDGQAWAAEEASRDAATKRAEVERVDQDEFLTKAIVALLSFLLVAGAAMMAVLAWNGKPIDNILPFWTTVAGIVVAKFGSRYDHRYGSSRSSGAKDIVIDELARRRK